MRRGGRAIDDPLAWFDGLSRETIDYWIEVDRLAPIGEEWRQTAQISHMLWMIYSTNVEFTTSPPDVSIDDFMPGHYTPPKEREASSSGSKNTDYGQQMQLCLNLGIPFN